MQLPPHTYMYMCLSIVKYMPSRPIIITICLPRMILFFWILCPHSYQYSSFTNHKKMGGEKHYVYQTLPQPRGSVSHKFWCLIIGVIFLLYYYFFFKFLQDSGCDHCHCGYIYRHCRYCSWPTEQESHWNLWCYFSDHLVLLLCGDKPPNIC